MTALRDQLLVQQISQDMRPVGFSYDLKVSRPVCNAVLRSELWERCRCHRCGRTDIHLLRSRPHKCKRCGREWR